MEQSTKLFLVLGFMFLLYITMKGNLEKYLRLLFNGTGTSNQTPSNTNSGIMLNQRGITIPSFNIGF